MGGACDEQQSDTQRNTTLRPAVLSGRETGGIHVRMRIRRRVEVALGIVASLSGLAALAYMLYAPRVQITSFAPLRDGSISQEVHYISMTDLSAPSLVWWGGALAVALVAVGVAVAAGLHAWT